MEVQKLTRSISAKIYEEYSIALTVGIYARNDRYEDIRSTLESIVEEYPEVLEIHGFIVYDDMNLSTFDMIVDFDADREAIKKEVLQKVKDKHPQFEYMIIDDYDVSD